MSYKIQKNIILVTFLFMPILLLCAFTLYPLAKQIELSFTDWNGFSKSYNYVGFDNFKYIATFPDVWISLRNNCYYIINGILQNMIALFFGAILVSKLRAVNFFKSVIFIPYILNGAAVAYMFTFIYGYEGPINMLLQGIGMEPVRFLSDGNIVNISIVAVNIWRYIGFTMMVYIAALQSVPREIYESSRVDGANSWQIFRYITLPNIRRIIELQLFLTLSGSLQAYTEALLMTNGGPGHSSYTFVFFIVNAGFTGGKFGYSSALAVTLMLVIILLTALQKRLVLGRKEA